MILQKKIIKFLLIVLLISLNSCGFQRVNNTFTERFAVKEITFSGDSRIGNILKNLILQNSKKESINLITIDLSINKKKGIKEKNISNKVTKYLIGIAVKAKISQAGKKEINYTFNKSTYLVVGDKNSQTKLKEIQLLDDLTNSVAEELTRSLNIKYK